MIAEPTVFIVDDDPAVLRSLTSLVEAIFPRVEAYGSAADFLNVYDRSRPGCLVLDVAMPGMSGLELQNRLSNQGIDLPVVFITGHGNVQMAVDAMQAGAVNFLEKPFREQDLWESIRKGLELDAERRQRQKRATEAQRRMELLSRGEREVLDRILQGKYNKQIAAELDLSIRTVEDRRARLMKKMQARSVVELVQLAMSR